MTGLTRRSANAVLLAEIGAMLAVLTTTAGRPLTLACVGLAVVGSTSPVRRVAQDAVVRILLQMLMVGVTALVLVQLHSTEPGLLTTRLLPVLQALLVLRIPLSRTCRDNAVDLIVATMLLVVCAASIASFGAGLPLLMIWPVLMLAALALHHESLLDDTVVVASRATARPDGVTPVIGATALACAVGLVTWLVLPAGESADLRHRLGVHKSSAFGGGPNTTPGQSGQRVATSYTSASLDLSLRGALPTDPVLRVPIDSPQLWRAEVFSDYDGQFWTARTQRAALIEGGPVHTLPALPEVFDTHGAIREDSASPLGTGTDAPVWSPGLPISIDTRGQVIVDTVGVAHVLGVRAAPAYAVRSIAPDADAAALRASTGPDPADTSWLATPASLPERVRALARTITSGAPDRFTTMRRVEAWLREHIAYDLNAPVPSAGRDAVDHLLFDTHRGFCEHFASAETVLLRVLGVPARVVTGLSGGTPTVGISGTRDFIASDAHAWVEVFFPGVGWVSSDPTAGAVLASSDGTGGLVTQAVESVRAGLNQLTQVPGGRRTLGLWVVALLVLMLLVGRRSGRPARAIRSMRGRHGPVLLAYLTYENRRRAMRNRAVDETARAYVDAMGELEILAAAVEVLEDECYGPHPPPGSIAAGAARDFESASLVGD